ncbi:hypothetical protein ACVW17_003648 [Bradyrhizobium sp. USDA 4473]
MYYVANIMRSKGDPKIVRSGPRHAPPADRLARSLGWFSIGLGTLELLAPRRITRPLGMQGDETLVRAFGLREIFSGIMSLSIDRNAGLWSRVAGDGLDAAALMSAMTRDNPKKHNVALALLMIGGIALLDYRGARETTRRPQSGRRRLYPDRSGFPKGLASARDSARKMLSRTKAASS